MIAFTFPGQGSQRHAMGAAWAEHPSWELVAEASDAVGRDLASLLLRADDDELRQTRNAQIATFVLSLVVLDAAERLGADAAAFAGHSLGEYSALVAAGTLAFADGARLVAERGEAMQEAAAAAPGTMAAVLGLDDGGVRDAVAPLTDVWLANLNGPGQVVVAGTPAGIDAAVPVLKAAGAKKVLPLPVGGAFHSPLMAPAATRLGRALSGVELRPSVQPVFANVDARPHHGAADDRPWADLLAEQLTAPVRWRPTLHALADHGVSTLVELGPGNVLTGLAKRTLPEARTIAVSAPEHLDALLELLAQPAIPPVGLQPHEGEHLFATERLVVSPGAGVFTPDGALGPGAQLRPGSVVGSVGGSAVCSPFGGTVVGVLALAGERLSPSQPIAWLRTS